MDSLIDRRRSRETPASRVLVVDDDATLRSQVASALKVTGFRTVEAADADGALTALAVNPDIAVVLSDIRMPGRSGIALAEELRIGQPGQRAVEVVLMSGHACFGEAVDAMRAGAFDLLRKPFRLAEIANVVSRAMARARARRQAARATEQARLEREALCLAAPVGLGRIGHDLRLAGANPVLTEMLGIAESANIADLWAQAPELRQELEPAVARILAGEAGQPAACLRIELPLRSGAGMACARVVDVRLYPVPDGTDASRVDAVGLACLDVTAETALLRELDHRVKNAFAVFLGLAHGAARHAADRNATDVVGELTGRVMALSRAHDLVKPAVGGRLEIAKVEVTTVRTLAEAVLAPFSGGGDARIALQGPDVALGPRAVSGLALVLHELVTNALKHGALSAPAGRVGLAWAAAADTLMLDWSETDGPPIEGPPARSGFGLRLLGQPNRGGMRLRTALDWSHPAGLQARICLSCASA
ncbi:sensor histidine kinase [Falsiroseomonas ponticola]|uniref:sensor histidine kinase n=1 Tax=Falsiroseomonas ponticola TaxID=2786951 RepID=UPI0019323940|nr:response regulator [Roseomonas ponticola]